MDEPTTLYWHRQKSRRRLLAPILLSIGVHLLLIAPLAAVFTSAHASTGAVTANQEPHVIAMTIAGQVDETSPDAQEWQNYVPHSIRSFPIDSSEEGPGTRSDAHPLTANGGVGSGSGSTGVPAHRAAGWFAVPGQPRSIVYLIDGSLSMAQNGALDAARRELLVELAELPRSCRVQIMVYDQWAQPLLKADQTGLTAVSSELMTEAAGALEKVLPANGTNHFTALQSAMILHPDVIVLVTDEVSEDDDLGSDEVRRLETMNRGKTAVNIVELTTTKQRPQHEGGLKLLSDASKGTFRSIHITH
jgi:hypothetical protein